MDIIVSGTGTNHEAPYGVIDIDCTCCQLRQRIKDRDGPVPKVCDTCLSHQGNLPDKRLARAESHEAMLRERLNACRASEERSRREVETAKERMASALASRGMLAYRLVNAAEYDRSHTCAVRHIADDPEVLEMARKHEERKHRW